MTIGDKYTDTGGATRIITDIINPQDDGTAEEVGFRIDGAGVVPGGATGKMFQSWETFAKEARPYVAPIAPNVPLTEAAEAIPRPALVAPKAEATKGTKRR